MLINKKSTRFNERTKLKVPLRVVYRENAEREWAENTVTEQITICGIGFRLSRPVEPRRLINLELAMPQRYRLFDFGKEKYNVWGIIRYLQMIDTGAADTIQLMVGAALIGPEPPASFLNDPKTLYDLKPILRKQSFWDWRELPRRSGPFRRSMEDRNLIEIEVTLQTVDEQGRIVETALAKTLNISENGAALVAELTADCERFALIKTADKRNFLLCAVRGHHRLDTANLVRLHVEFISGGWTF